MKKILISTISAWNQNSGANTYSAMFSKFKKDAEIANIYFRADMPDSDVAKRYFHILENEVIKSIFHRDRITGKEVSNYTLNGEDTLRIQSEKNRYSRFSKRHNPFFMWGREVLWKLGRWNSKELNFFLNDIAPDIFFFPLSNYCYFNRVNEYIVKKCKPKMVVGFLGDDTFTYKQRSDLFYYINRFFIRKSVKRLVGQCDEVLAICPKMKQECDRFFHINSEVITKPIRDVAPSCYIRDLSKPIRLIYTGGLYLGRDESLISLAKAIQEINQEKQYMYLDIYTNTSLKNEILSALNIPGCCEVKGSIPQCQVFEEQEKSDILVLVESFSDKTARLSFSTKITDYLSSNRCILAIGPEDISSMEYLKNEDAAIICNSTQNILPILKQLKDDANLIKEYAEKGYRCGVRNHSSEEINKRLKNVLKLEEQP